MLTKIVDVVLVDINPRMVKAWQQAFGRNPEVRIKQGSMLDMAVDAWVTPTNSLGRMDGGLDLAIKNFLGPGVEREVKREIARRYGGSMPVGYATCVEAGRAAPKYLISAPTMCASSQDISDTLNVALACAAAFQMVDMVNGQAGTRRIHSVALPGLGACTGRVPVATCAYLMWVAYTLFEFEAFASFDEMRAALERELWKRMERAGAA
jgi:O-acetyl-ADP-ribose deacetylase (regulator of RNase III)